MRVFRLDALGDRASMQRHVVVDRRPRGLGLRTTRLGSGKPIGPDVPPLSVALRESWPGRELSDVLSTTEWLLLANARTVECVRGVAGDQDVEYLPFTLHAPDETLLSADYAVVHPVRFCDVVDRAASVLRFQGDITGVESYVLDRGRCHDLPPLFRVPEWSYDIFLNETLARALHGARIGNLFLHEVTLR
jgi:hypothetical protein